MPMRRLLPTMTDVTGKKMQEILRWVCQASAPGRADAETGDLTAAPVECGKQGDAGQLGELSPCRANQSLAALIFTLSDGTVCGFWKRHQQRKTVNIRKSLPSQPGTGADGCAADPLMLRGKPV